MIEPIEYNKEDYRSLKQSYSEVQKRYQGLLVGFRTELRERYAALNEDNDDNIPVGLGVDDLWAALNNCIFNTNARKVTDFQASCLQFYRQTEGFMNRLPQGSNVVGLHSADVSNLQFQITNPVQAIGAFGIAKLIVQGIDVCYRVKAKDKERELLEAANQYLSINTEQWLGAAVRNIISIICGQNDYVQLFRNCVAGIGMVLTCPPTPEQRNMASTCLPYADLAYGIFDRENGILPITRDLDTFRLNFREGFIHGKFNLAKSLRGYIGVDPIDNRVVVSFRGSKNLRNWFTNAHQLLFGPDITYLMAVGLVGKACLNLPENSILNVVGHSLGGGLAQYATAAINQPNVMGVCYNSAGLSIKTYDTLRGHNTYDSYNVKHTYVSYDLVFKVGIQLGTGCKFNLNKDPYHAHLMPALREACNNYEYFGLK